MVYSCFRLSAEKCLIRRLGQRRIAPNAGDERCGHFCRFANGKLFRARIGGAESCLVSELGGGAGWVGGGWPAHGAECGYVRADPHVLVPWYLNGTQTVIQSDGHSSWASPQTVGTAVLIDEVYPSFTPDQTMQIMRDSATWVYDPTSGIEIPELNVNAAIALAYQRSGVATPAPTPTPTPAPRRAPIRW